MAQDAPDVAWADVELLVVGVVEGDCRVELVVDELDVVDEPDVADDVEPPETVEVTVVAPPLLLLVVALACEALLLPAEVAVDVAWWGWAAKAANRPTPPSEPAATQAVARRLRRSHVSRREGVVMTPSKSASPQSRLSARSAPRYKLLGASWERTAPVTERPKFAATGPGAGTPNRWTSRREIGLPPASGAPRTNGPAETARA
jgi:hypothetical protein